MQRTLISVVIFLAQISMAGGSAQVKEFSAVSIHPSASGSRSSYQETPDRIIARASTTLFLLSIAFQLPEYRFIIGAPKWVSEEKYDVIATLDDQDQATFNAGKQGKKTDLLRPLFADRYKLKYHMEAREFPEYALTLAKGGIKTQTLKLAAPNDDPPTWKQSGYYELAAHNMNMANLCSVLLTTEAGKLVFDDTGLPGKYDFTLRWSREPEDMLPGSQSIDAPRIFDALKEQLGLQLAPRQISTKVLVIDHIERPDVD
jgi:uncharacterized protein (TIGR03435 family)